VAADRSARGKMRGPSGVRSLYLEAFSPIAGTTLGVGNGDDLDFVQAFAEDHRERKAPDDYAAGAVQVLRANLRSFTQLRESCLKLNGKIQASHSTSAPVPINCFAGFRFGFRVVLKWLHSRCLLAIWASRSARNSSCGIIFTAPESISSRRRLISSDHEASISEAESSSSAESTSCWSISPMAGKRRASSRSFCAFGLIGRL
jgi:hypothetical protein